MLQHGWKVGNPPIKVLTLGTCDAAQTLSGTYLSHEDMACHRLMPPEQRRGCCSDGVSVLGMIAALLELHG